MSALFLGIDIGTTKIKAVLFDDQGGEKKLARRSSSPETLPDGSVLQNMDALWETVADTIREVCADSASMGEIKGVGITAMGDGLWLLDREKKPVQDAILWTDGRAAPYISRWEQEGIIGISGRVAFAGSPLAFSAWSFDNRPEVMERAEHMLFCKDWIKLKLTGSIVTDHTDLSDASLVDSRTREYEASQLAAFGVEPLMDLLPEVRDSAQVIGTVTREAAELTGLPQGVPVVNGMIDVASSAIGCGVLAPGSACSIVGTTLYSEIAVDTPAIPLAEKNPPSLICHGEPGRWMLSLGTMVGTPNLDWYMNEFMGGIKGSVHFDLLEEKLEQDIPPGCDGIIFHPYLGNGGERAPFVKSTASAQFFGLKARHTRMHLLRAVYEGVAYSMKDCYRNFPITPDYIRLAGGGSASRFWSQMFASATGISTQVTGCKEIGALGAAITASIGCGHYAGFREAIERMVHVQGSYDPILSQEDIYEENYQLYTGLRRQVWDLWDQRSDMLKKRENVAQPLTTR